MRDGVERSNIQLGLGRRERRQAPREPESGEPPLRYLVEVILGTYGEMPGLTLNLRQAARLFGLREETCGIVLDELVRQGRLRRAIDGEYLAV